jgi:hypothetical protein
VAEAVTSLSSFESKLMLEATKQELRDTIEEVKKIGKASHNIALAKCPQQNRSFQLL